MSYDALINEKLEGFLQQHDSLMNYVHSNFYNVVFYYPKNGQVQFVDRSGVSDLSCRHRLSLIAEAIQSYRSIFKMNLGMVALRDFNFYAIKLEEKEKGGKDGKTGDHEGHKNHRPHQHKLQRNDSSGERPHYQKKVRKVLDGSVVSTPQQQESVMSFSSGDYYGPPPSVSVGNQPSSQNGMSSAVMCRQLPDGTFVPVSKVSMLIDTGNSLETLIPSSLLSYFFNIRACNQRIQTFNNQDKGVVAKLRAE